MKKKLRLHQFQREGEREERDPKRNLVLMISKIQREIEAILMSYHRLGYSSFKAKKRMSTLRMKSMVTAFVM